MILPNGVEVYNATPHRLVFYEQTWLNEVVVPGEEILTAYARNVVIGHIGEVELVKLTFQPMEEGLELIERIKRRHPKALIVGSIIAAQAYRGDVVSPVPCYRGSREKKTRVKQEYVKASRFTIFPKEQ